MKGGVYMLKDDKENPKPQNEYDDGNIPDVDLPPREGEASVEPLPASTRPRKDGPGGS